MEGGSGDGDQRYSVSDASAKRLGFESAHRVERQYSPLHAYLLIREAILSGELPPGTLLDENSMMVLTDHSRASVREALRRLAANDVVVRQRRTGTRVATKPLLRIELRSFQSLFSPDVSLARLRRSDSIRPPVVSGTIDATTSWQRVEGTLIQCERGIGTITVFASETVDAPILATPGVVEEDLPAAFRRTHGVEFGSVTAGVDAIRVDAATVMELQDGEPNFSVVLVITRSLIDADGKLREQSVAQFTSGKVRIEV